MIVKTKGIVIRETNYRETSKILDILTEDYGVLGVISRGSRTMKSHLRGVSQKLVFGEFIINKRDKGVSSLSEVNVIPLWNIQKDILLASYALYIIDIVNQVIRDKHINIYSLLINILMKLDAGLNPLLITNIFELQLLKYLGVNLNLQTCVLCGAQNGFKTISSSLGGVICHQCSCDSYIMEPRTVKIIILMMNVPLDRLDNVSINDEKIIKEINDFIIDYYQTYTGIYLKSKDGIRKLEGYY